MSEKVQFSTVFRSFGCGILFRIFGAQKSDMREYSLLKFLSQSLDRLYLWWTLTKTRVDHRPSNCDFSPLTTSEYLDSPQLFYPKPREVPEIRFMEANRIPGVEVSRVTFPRAVVDPVRLARHNRMNRILAINGLYDQVVPAKFTLQLWESLGRPLIRWYLCAHISFFLFLKRIVNDVVRFIQGN